MSEATNECAPEVRERAVQMALEHERDHSSRWAAVVSISVKISVPAEGAAISQTQPDMSRLVGAIPSSGH